MSTLSVVGRLLRIARGRWGLMAVGSAMVLSAPVLAVGLAWIMKRLVDSAGAGDWAQLKSSIVIGLGVFLAGAATAFLKAYVIDRFIETLAQDLRQKTFDSVVTADLTALDRLHTADVTSRIMNDVNVIKSSLSSDGVNLIQQPLVAAAAFAYLWYLNPPLTLCGLAIGPLLMLLSRFFSGKLRQLARSVQERSARVHQHVQDSLSAVALAKAYELEGTISRLMGTHLAGLTRSAARVSWHAASLGAASSFIGNMSFMVCFGVGGILVIRGSLTMGSLVAFLNLMYQLINPFTSLSQSWARVQGGVSAAGRVFHVIDLPRESWPTTEAQPIQAAPRVEVRHLSFAYGSGAIVFEDLDFTVEPGEKVAIVGPSGCGKTTLFRLLLGLYRPQKGEILFDGVPAGNLGAHALRSMTTLVPQEPMLLQGTIRQNITLWREDDSSQRLLAAAEAAGVSELADSLPDAYEFDVGERGGRLSRGQQQRVSLARGMWKAGKVVLLDEVTASLDTDSETAILKRLTPLLAGSTALIVTHRPALLQLADRIIVLEGGRVRDTIDRDSGRWPTADQALALTTTGP